MDVYRLLISMDFFYTWVKIRGISSLEITNGVARRNRRRTNRQCGGIINPNPTMSQALAVTRGYLLPSQESWCIGASCLGKRSLPTATGLVQQRDAPRPLRNSSSFSIKTLMFWGALFLGQTLPLPIRLQKIRIQYAPLPVVRLNVTIHFKAGQQPHLVPFRDIPCKSIDPSSPDGYSLLSKSTKLDDPVVESLTEIIYPIT